MTSFDISLFHWLNSWAGQKALVDLLIVFLAVYLWHIMAGAILVFWLMTFLPKFRAYRERHTKLLVLGGVSATVARFVVAEAVRFLYHRPRPFMVFEGIKVLKHQLLGSVATSYSFPSGHASLAFAVAAAVSFYYPKTSIFFFLAAVLIGVGRVAAGVHWPSDILGGAMAGLLVAFVARVFFRTFVRH